MKKVSDSYLYQTADYEKGLMDYLMNSTPVDKNSDSFSDIVYAVKKQALSIVVKVLLSDKVVLLMNDKGVSRAFKVIYAKDIKSNKDKMKVFIDCSGVIVYENGNYVCKKIGNLVSYLMTAMSYIIYYNNPNAILSNRVLTKSGTTAFVNMMIYVLGYLKVPISYNDNKERMSFAIAEYYQLCVLGVPQSETVLYTAKQVSGLQDQKTCEYLHTLFGLSFKEGKATIDDFLKKFAEVFLDQKEGEPTPKNRARLTIEAFAQRWMYAYGHGTYLGLECFVPFSQMLTDCYNGSFINQQTTIEKVAGSKDVNTFSNELLKVGSENG